MKTLTLKISLYEIFAQVFLVKKPQSTEALNETINFVTNYGYKLRHSLQKWSTDYVMFVKNGYT